MSGINGNSGRKPTHLLYDGKTGDKEIYDSWLKTVLTVIFHLLPSVTYKVTTYSEIFDIRLHHIVARSATGVFEPEAQIYIDTLTVHTIPTMPTPRRPPLRATDTLHLTATMTGLQRVFPAFDIDGRPINIQYPIEFTHISHMNSMVVGHVVKSSGVGEIHLKWISVLSKNGRRIRVKLDKMDGEVSRSALQFGLHPQQQGTATVSPVQTMETGQTLQLEASLTLSEAEPFEFAEFWLHLELGNVGIFSSSFVTWKLRG
ncbi:3118_t:CDS:2 [Ambispora gerdemannii]|uniref:3118_t:CDS:1 n=1 Tax=Ambispora gerdemannii TaxID=144530 RepID=A0A9N8WS89_9GLOM|nr:3118_t:CDS:2 [Ambispora gerdemannii]